MSEKDPTIELRPPVDGDAQALFPLIHGTSVAETLAWDGPETLQEYRHALRSRGLQVAAGLAHFFTIVERASSQAIGSCDVRPDEDGIGATVGLWIGERHQGRGYGTLVIGESTRYAFEVLGVRRVEADVFVGNWRSRKAFERNGFTLLRTIPAAVMKRGKPVDEWRMGLERERWEKPDSSPSQ